MSDKKNKSTFDKLILGAIIGAAVGSVIGASVAPDDGKTTRSKLSSKINDLTSEFKDKVHQQETVLVEPEKPKSFFKKLLNLIIPNDRPKD